MHAHFDFLSTFNGYLHFSNKSNSKCVNMNLPSPYLNISLVSDEYNFIRLLMLKYNVLTNLYEYEQQQQKEKLFRFNWVVSAAPNVLNRLCKWNSKFNRSQLSFVRHAEYDKKSVNIVNKIGNEIQMNMSTDCHLQCNREKKVTTTKPHKQKTLLDFISRIFFYFFLTFKSNKNV